MLNKAIASLGRLPRANPKIMAFHEAMSRLHILSNTFCVASKSSILAYTSSKVVSNKISVSYPKRKSLECIWVASKKANAREQPLRAKEHVKASTFWEQQVTRPRPLRPNSLSTKRKPSPIVVEVEAVTLVVVVEVTVADTVVVGGRQERSQGTQGGVVQQHAEHYET